MKNVLKIVNNNECCGCGTCSVVCKKIKLQKNSQGFCNPQIENSCSSCGNCLVVCPRENTETDYINNVFYKNIERDGGLVCYSENDEIRNKSASGGFITQFLINLLNAKVIDGAILAFSDGTFENTKAIIATSEEDILNSKSSKYFPVSMVSVLKNIEKEKKYAFVGKGCDIKGLTLLSKKLKFLNNAIILKIGLMCAATPSQTASENLYKNMTGKEYSKDNSKLFYRYNGWPGDAIAAYKKETFSMPYMISWCKNLSPDHGFHCNVCGNHFAEDADIVVGDAWYKNKKLENNGGGFSLVIPLSNKAKSLIQSYDVDLNIDVCSYNDVLYSQENLFRRQDIYYIYHYFSNFFKYKNHKKPKVFFYFLKKYSYKTLFYYVSMYRNIKRHKK